MASINPDDENYGRILEILLVLRTLNIGTKKEVLSLLGPGFDTKEQSDSCDIHLIYGIIRDNTGRGSQYGTICRVREIITNFVLINRHLVNNAITVYGEIKNTRLEALKTLPDDVVYRVIMPCFYDEPVFSYGFFNLAELGYAIFE